MEKPFFIMNKPRMNIENQSPSFDFDNMGNIISTGYNYRTNVQITGTGMIV